MNHSAAFARLETVIWGQSQHLYVGVVRLQSYGCLWILQSGWNKVWRVSIPGECVFPPRSAMRSPSCPDISNICWNYEHPTSLEIQQRGFEFGSRLDTDCLVCANSQPKTEIEIKSSSEGQLLKKKKKKVVKEVLIFIHRGLKICKSREESPPVVASADCTSSPSGVFRGWIKSLTINVR